MANSRYYSSIAQQTTLTSGITSSGTTMIVAATTGFPGSLPYILAVDYGANNEELVLVTGVAGTTLTVTRAYDNTSGSSHNPGAVVRHVAAAIDHTDSRTHEAATSGVHGVTGSVVGTSDTQTLTNKTVTNVLGSARNFKLYNTGATGVTQVIGDSTNGSVNRLEILDNEVNVNILSKFTSTGALYTLKLSGEADNVYKYRLTDNNGTTDRFTVLSGGTVAITPTSATTFVALDIVAPDTTSTKRAIRIAASGGGTERFTVWNDGRVDIVGSTAANSQLDVTAAASQSADIMRVLDSSSNSLFVVQSNGKMLANVGGIIAQPGVTSGAVLQVGGSNTGYTGNLQQWVSPANTIVAKVTEAGNFTAVDGTFTGNLAVTGTGTVTGNFSANNYSDWVSYSPTWAGLTSQGTGATSTGRWKRDGNRIEFIAQLTAGTSPSLGTGTITVTLPSTASSTPTGNLGWQGTGRHNGNDGSTFKVLIPMINPGATTATVFGLRQSDAGWTTPGTAGFVWVAGSNMRVQGSYEI